MKQLFTHTRALRLAAVLGLTAVFAGLGTLSPARADDDWHFHRWHDHARYDMVAVHRDENRLHDLYTQRRIAARNHNWDRVHALDRRITDARFHLDHDRYVTDRPWH